MMITDLLQIKRDSRYCAKSGAPDLAHSRRKVYEAQDVEPGPAGQALESIGALYAVEAQIREQRLTGAAKRAHRRAHAMPVADRFFAWIDKQFAAQGFFTQ